MAGDRPEAELGRWDMEHGRRFQKKVAAKIGTQVHFPKSTPDGSFLMLAVFRRYTFRLDDNTVSHALSSVLGGPPSSFHVRRESERHFRFSVASKAVGYLVLDLRRAITQHFDVFFYLWRDGGADWKKDRVAWEKEEERSWILVTSKKSKRLAKKVSFASPVKQCSPQSKPKPRPPDLFIKFGEHKCPIPNLASSSSSSTVAMKFQGNKFQISNKGAQQDPRVAEKNGHCLHIGQRKDLRLSEQGADKVRQARKKDWPRSQAKDPRRDSGINDCESMLQRHAGTKVCFRCLSLRHLVRECTSEIRCKACYNYGHVARLCIRRRLASKHAWQEKLKPQSMDTTSSTNIQLNEPQQEHQQHDQWQRQEPWPAWEQAANAKPAPQGPDQDQQLIQGAGPEQHLPLPMVPPPYEPTADHMEVEQAQQPMQIEQLPLQASQLPLQALQVPPAVQWPQLPEFPDFLPAAQPAGEVIVEQQQQGIQWPDFLPAAQPGVEENIQQQKQGFQWTENLPAAPQAAAATARAMDTQENRQPEGTAKRVIKVDGKGNYSRRNRAGT